MSAVNEPTAEQYARLGRFTAALLGSHEEWPGSEMLEWIAEAAGTLPGFPGIGDQSPEELTLWRGIAETLGIEHDGEDDEEEEEEE